MSIAPHYYGCQKVNAPDYNYNSNYANSEWDTFQGANNNFEYHNQQEYQEFGQQSDNQCAEHYQQYENQCENVVHEPEHAENYVNTQHSNIENSNFNAMNQNVAFNYPSYNYSVELTQNQDYYYYQGYTENCYSESSSNEQNVASNNYYEYNSNYHSLSTNSNGNSFNIVSDFQGANFNEVFAQDHHEPIDTYSEPNNVGGIGIQTTNDSQCQDENSAALSQDQHSARLLFDQFFQDPAKSKFYWCSLCCTKFTKLYYLKRHFLSKYHNGLVAHHKLYDPKSWLIKRYTECSSKNKIKAVCDKCNSQYSHISSLKRHKKHSCHI